MDILETNYIKLHEAFIGPGGISNDIQLVRVGKFKLKSGSIIDISKKDLKSMVTNFSKDVRGVDIMLDYSHNSQAAAAAWFQTVFLSEDEKELWATVDWTPGGTKATLDKEFRYVSADIDPNFEDNETGKFYGPTLNGAGLTNRPVIKKMKPIILAEHNNGDNKMELEEIKKKLAELQEENKKLKGDNENFKKQFQDKDSKMAEAKLKEREDAIEEKEKEIKLAEEKAANDIKLAEKKTAFDKMLSEDGSVKEAQRDSYMKGDMVEFLKNAPKAGEINLSEKGNSGTGGSKGNPSSKTPAQDKVIKLAEEKMKEDKELSMGQAQSEVLFENQKLAEDCQKETE